MQEQAATIVERLYRGETILTLGIRMARTPDIARMARAAGYAVIWIDLEHSGISIDCAGQIAACAHDLGLEAWVRTPEGDYGVIGRVLDGGATGIIAPRTETVEQARAAVIASRFPPRGQRSQIGLLPQNGFVRASAAQLNSMADGMTTVQVLLETRQGIDNAHAIAAIDGVDVIAVGLNDLAADLGCLGDVRHEKVRAACRQVADAARQQRKLAVVGGVHDSEHCSELLSEGFAPLVFAGIDSDIVNSGICARAADWRARIDAKRAPRRPPLNSEPQS